MMRDKIGHKIVKSVFYAYSDTAYLPKLSSKNTAEEISTEIGVTQGKTSSASFFSFYVSDMVEDTETVQAGNENSEETYVVQLADDTAIIALANEESLRGRVQRILEYSSKKFLRTNMKKTEYLRISSQPSTDPLFIDQNTYIKHCDKNGYRYLGITFIQSQSIQEQILRNINEKKSVFVKFFAWMDNNRRAPIKIKLQVLYTCVFPTLLYGVETWWAIDSLMDDILKMERNALCSLRHDEALVRSVMDRCESTQMMYYYKNLVNGNKDNDVNERIARMQANRDVMTVRYMSLTEGKYAATIYDSNMDEEHRIIITRWRMACFDLAIETDKWRGIDRDKRICRVCFVVEDEKHVIFDCLRYHNIRNQFGYLFTNCRNVKDILNPKTSEFAKLVGKYLKLIEDERKCN